MNGFHKPIIAALLFLTGIFNWAPAQGQLACYDFEDFDREAVFGESSGHAPGDVVFERSGYAVALATFDLGANAEPLFGDAALRFNFPSPNVDPYLIIGRHLVLEDISLEFNFSDAGQAINKLCFNYLNPGGALNLSVNGEGLALTGDWHTLNGREIAPGVIISVEPRSTATLIGGAVCLKGNIKSLLIGGRRLLLDGLCYSRELSDDCPLEGVTAYVQNCIPNLPPQLVIDLDLAFQAQLTSRSFDLYLNGEFQGAHSYADLPLVLHQFPQTDFLKVWVCDGDRADCCVSAEAEFRSCPRENCIDFNELESGTVWGRDAGHQPGDLVYEKNGVKTTVDKFHYLNGTTDFWNVKVEEDIFGGGFPQLEGKELFISNINLQFDFSGLNHAVEGLCFDFVDGGGEENFSVNGREIKVLRNLWELQGQEVAPGVWLYITPALTTTNVPAGRLCLKGAVKSLLIGGQEFAFDNLCLRLDQEEECAIRDLIVRPLPCTPNGVFYAEMKFDVQSPSSDSFFVLVDGRRIGRFAYADGFPRLGPFQGDHNAYHSILVYDSQNRLCFDRFLLGPMRCHPDCGIGNLKAFIERCNDDGSYDIRVDLDHHNSQQIGFDLYIEGRSFGFYPYAQLPLLIEGFMPVTDALSFELKVCENDNDNCCISTTISLQNPCPLSECIDFEDWPADGAWGREHGDRPGDVIFRTNAYNVSLHTFSGIDWTNVFGELSIERDEAGDVGRWGGRGQYLSFEHISAFFHFAQFPGGVQMLSFDYRLEQGPMIIGVNDGRFLTIYRNALPGMYSLTDETVLEIVFDSNDQSSGRVIIKGNIRRLLIGGADLDIDNICLNRRQEECRIFNIQKEIVCRPDAATYDLYLKFEHAGTGGQGFIVIVDGREYGPFRYDQLPVKIEGLPWTEPAYHTLAICDQGPRNACCAELRYQIECRGPCKIGELRTWVGECNADGEYRIKIDFDHENTGGKFWVTTNVTRQAFGPYAYEELPVEIGPLPGHPDINVAVTVTDAEFQDCFRRKTLGVIDCRPRCRLYDPEFGEPVCDPTTPNRVIDVKLDFQHENVGGEYFVVTTAGGAWAVKYRYADLPVLLENVPVPAGQDYLVFEICDTNLDGCCLEAKLLIPCAPGPCEIGELKTEISTCVDGHFKVALNFDHARTSGKFVVTTNISNQVFGPFAYADLPVTVGPLPGNTGREVVLTVRDREFQNCVNRKSLGVIQCPAPECRIYDVTFGEPVCNDAGNAVQVKLDFEHENVGSDYFVVKFEDGRAARYKYADLPVLLDNVPIPGGANRIWIRICDAEIDGCCREAELEVRCPPACEIGALITEVGECEDGQYKVWLNFRHANTSGRFWVTTNITDRAFGPFAYEDLPVAIGPLPGSGEEVVLTVRDEENPNCGRRKSLGVIDCQCRIGELTTEIGDCEDGGYKVWLNFRHANTGGQFWVTANVTDQAFGPFAYSDLPVVFGPLPGSEEEAVVVVRDAENPDCGSRKSLGVVRCPPPECRIYNLRYSEVVCNPGTNTFSVKINFRVEGPHSEFYTFTLENGRQGTFRYEDLPLVLENIPYPENGAPFRFAICDARVEGCCLEGSIEIPCRPNRCEIGPLQLEPTACNSDGMYMVDIKFRHAGAGERFGLFVNGDLVGRFRYDELPLRVGPYPGDGETTLNFRVVDASGDCESTGRLGPVSCEEGCVIRQIIAEPHACENGQYLVDLEVRADDPGPLGFYIFADGQISGPFSYSAPFITIGPFPGDGVSVTDILVLDISDPSCFGYVEIGPVDCGGRCVIEEVDLDARPCLANGTFFAKVEVEVENPGDRGFRILVNNRLFGESFSYEEEVLVGPLEADGETTYRIAVIDNEHPDCVKVAVLGPVFCQLENVWPGDANSDNVVQHFDLLNIGLAFRSQGPARAPDMATSVWEGVFALPWATNFTNGLNYKHADCNGDGLVDEDDVAVIKRNYGRDHGARQVLPDLPFTNTDPPIFAAIPQPGELANGDEFHVPIHLGEMAVPVEDIYGVAFSLFFDPNFIDPASLWIEYPASWFGEKGINVITLDSIFAEGRIDMALTRIDLNEVSGYGQVAILHGIIDDIAGRIETEIHVEHIFAIDGRHNRVALRNSIARLSLNPEEEGILSDIQGSVEVFPNPTLDEVTIRNKYNLPIESLELFSVSGRRLRTPVLNANRISLAGLEGGIYFLRLKLGGVVIHKKVIKE